MIKPILTVGIPNAPTQSLMVEIRDELESYIKDYYIITYLVFEGSEVVFNVFYDKDFKEINYDELREMIKQQSNDRD